MTPIRGAECPPALTLEACVAGEIELPHLASCAVCRTYVETLQREQTAFRASQAPLRAPPPRRIGPAPWVAVAALAASLAVVFFMRAPAETVAFKGERFHALVRHVGATTAEHLENGEQLAAGDSLRFTFEAPRDGYLLIVEKDGEGRVTVFWPFGATHSGAIRAASSKEPLSGAVELDASKGPASLTAIFSPQPRSALDATPCDGCLIETVRYTK